MSPQIQAAFRDLFTALTAVRDRLDAYDARDPTGYREKAETVRILCRAFGAAIDAYIGSDKDEDGRIFSDGVLGAGDYLADNLESDADEFAAEPYVYDPKEIARDD